MKHQLQRLRAIIFFCFFYSFSFTQITFQREFAVADSTLSSRGIVETSDGNIAIAARILLRQPNQEPVKVQSVLSLLNSYGDIIWTLKFDPGPFSALNITDIEATPDGGVIVLVMERINNGIEHHFNILKVSAAGVVDWIKTTTADAFYYRPNLRAVNGGYLIANPNTASPGTLIFKIDYTGNMLWQKNLSDVVLSATHAAADPDGHIYLPGGISPQSAALGSSALPILVKLNQDGALIWAKTYTDSFISSPIPALLSIRKCLYYNGTLSLISNNFESRDLIITQTDTDGHPIIQKRFPFIQQEGIFSFFDGFNDASGAIYGLAYSNLYKNTSHIFRLNQSLEMVWHKSYGTDGSGLLQLNTMRPLHHENGFLLAGAYSDTTFDHVAILKTDTNGVFGGPCCPGAEEVLQGTAHTVMATDTVLSELPNLTFTIGEAYYSKINAETNRICKPAVAMILPKDTLVCPGRCTEVSVMNSVPGYFYSWTFPMAVPDSSSGTASVAVCFGDEGQYHVILSEQGCVIDSSILKVDRRPEQYPNAFTPNGDGVNEIFRPVGWCPVEEFSMEVYNRWGQRVFISTAPNEGWNGEVNGSPAPPDVYIYQVTYYAYINGVRTLLRNEKKEVTLVR